MFQDGLIWGKVSQIEICQTADSADTITKPKLTSCSSAVGELLSPTSRQGTGCRLALSEGGFSLEYALTMPGCQCSLFILVTAGKLAGGRCSGK